MFLKGHICSLFERLIPSFLIFPYSVAGCSPSSAASILRQTRRPLPLQFWKRSPALGLMHGIWMTRCKRRCRKTCTRAHECQKNQIFCVLVYHFFASCIELHFNITLGIFQIVDVYSGLYDEERMLWLIHIQQLEHWLMAAQ